MCALSVSDISYVLCLRDQVFHLRSILEGKRDELPPEFWKLSDLPFSEGNMFQKRSVSSPAPVTMLWPSGLIER